MNPGSRHATAAGRNEERTAAMSDQDTRKTLAALFRRQRFAVLATARAGEPYANLVAFAATPDLRELLFITPRATRKYENLLREPRVALLVDSRANRAADVRAAVAVTALGRAAEATGPARDAWLALYLKRHPGLRTFAAAPTSTLFRVRVERYVLVDHFQHVVCLELPPAP